MPSKLRPLRERRLIAEIDQLRKKQADDAKTIRTIAAQRDAEAEYAKNLRGMLDIAIGTLDTVAAGIVSHLKTVNERYHDAKLAIMNKDRT